MESKKINVLFMDDEPSSVIIQATLERLREEGFDVDFTETMSRAIEAYYKKYYDVFVLDIDMSHLPDEQEGDGVKVLKRFISLHNQTRVILFSGAGTVRHWFEAANAHCHAYVAKDETHSIDTLVEHIRSAVMPRPTPASLLQKEECPPRVLVCGESSDIEAGIRSAMQNVFPGWETRFVKTLQEAEEALTAGYGVVLLFKEKFVMRTGEKESLRRIVSLCPKPQVLVACNGLDDNRPSILYLANLHPFAMIDLLDRPWQPALETALGSARDWYGQERIFPADMEALKRIHVVLPEDALSEWADVSPEELEEAYEDYSRDAAGSGEEER